MKQDVISFKSISSEGLKAKTYVSCFDGNIRIIQRGFRLNEPTANEELLRKVGKLYFVQTEIAFKQSSWIFINQIVDYLLA